MNRDQPIPILDYARPRMGARRGGHATWRRICRAVFPVYYVLTLGTLLVMLLMAACWQGALFALAVAALFWIDRGVHAWLRARQRKRWARREASGLCPICAYDMRGTPRRCPECGTESLELYRQRLHREMWPNEAPAGDRPRPGQ